MDFNQAKEALKRICQVTDKRENKEVNQLIYEHPSLINEVNTIFKLKVVNIWYCTIGFGFWGLDGFNISN